MRKQLIFFLFITLFLASCSRTNRLSEDDYSWMPYRGTETLVFKANTGETDTIFILKKDTLLSYPEAQAFNGIKYEEVAVFCNHYGQNKDKPGRSYYFFKVQKAKNSRPKLDFDLSTKGAVFYRLTPVMIDSLNKIAPTTLQTSYGKYGDIYIIHPDEYGNDFYGRDDFVTKLYWSKSEGLIRYDKKDGVYWELMNE